MTPAAAVIHSAASPCTLPWVGRVGLGFHFLQALEARIAGTATITYFGDVGVGAANAQQTGILGNVRC